MSNTTNRSRNSMVLAVALGILVMTVGAPAFAGSSVAVVGSSVNGGVVNVTVKNNSFLPQIATVSVEAVVDGRSSSTFVPVVLTPGQTAMVSAGFTGTVSSVVRIGLSMGVILGMGDDGTPF